MRDQRATRELHQGFGDGFSRAMEIAIAPVLFGFVGHLLDRVFGISPILMITFALFAVAGLFVRMWYGYDAQMRAHEAEGPWNRASGTTPKDVPS